MISLEHVKVGLKNGEFYLAYMPTISLDDGRCVGAESLIRWRHGGIELSPDEFIPLCEGTPVIGLLTYWIVEEVARELGEFLRAQNDIHISINVSPETLGRGGIAYAFEQAGLMDIKNKIILEVTERGIPDKFALNALRFNQDVRIALDDFGTGEANLAHVSELNADIIKLDKLFVDQITDPKQAPKIVKGIVGFSQAVDMQIIAEGVETTIQSEVLKDLGVQMAQGWLYSKPLSGKEFCDFFISS